MEAALNSALGRFALGSGALKIGRAPDNALVLQDPQSSSHHAEVTPGPDGNSYLVTDLGSTNGTFVNEQRLAPHAPRPLNAGDVIRIGQTTITYEASGAAGYAPTVLASPPSYTPTVAASDFTPPPQPVMPQPQAYGSVVPPMQPSYTPPPAYPQPQPIYPQVQPAYPQPQPGFQPQQGAYPQGAAPYMPQPAYAPPGFGQPGMPQKKSHTGLIVTLVIVLVVLVGGGGAGAYLLTRSTPQKTLAAYCDGLKTNNAQEIYNSLSARDQTQTSVSKIQTGLQGLTLLTGGITGCDVSNVQESGSTATATITLTPARGQAQTTTAHLVNENGQWKVEANANSV